MLTRRNKETTTYDGDDVDDDDDFHVKILNITSPLYYL